MSTSHTWACPACSQELKNEQPSLCSSLPGPNVTIPPLILLNVPDSESESNSQDSDGMYDQVEPYQHLLSEIMVLHDETEQAQFLNCLEVPLLHAPQVHLLEHFAVFQPLLFHKKLCVEPAIFDCIIDKIHKNVTFHSGSNKLQLPISIQLAIFLNHAGQYGNVISPEDVAQWAGVSVRSVVNCTHHVMIALLSCHNEYIVVPPVDSEDAELSHTFVEEQTCPGWQNGVMVEDTPISFSPFSPVDCTMISHFLFNDFVAIAFPDLTGDLDVQI